MKLMTSATFGAFDLPNRILMAPMTRARATREHVPTPRMADYYAQRAGAGLIISEATGISRQGLGWPYAPGLWTDEQVAAWRPVTQGVHDAGGRILAQLWHMGRLVHPSLGGAQPVSSSATTAPGKAHTYDGKQPYAEARALALDEIPGIVADYAAAARSALSAGFDGVQIHAANGYLIDQFLRDGANHRTDGYGGAIENRARLLLEVTDAVAAEVGAARTAVRLSPNGDSQGVIDSDPKPLFAYVAQALDARGLAFLELREVPREGTFGSTDQPPVSPVIRRHFKGPLVLNSDYTPEGAEAALAAGAADAISFGRPFIANPDLVQRIATGAALAESEVASWYSQGDDGYLDYPPLVRAA